MAATASKDTKDKTAEAKAKIEAAKAATEAKKQDDAVAAKAEPKGEELAKENLTPFEQRLLKGVPRLVVPAEYTRTYGRKVNPREVRNLPAMLQVAWPSLPKYDGGWSLSDCRSKGYRPVEPDEVSMIDRPDRLWLSSFEIVDGFVVVMGSILCIGHKESIAARKRAERLQEEAKQEQRRKLVQEQDHIEAEEATQEVNYSPLVHGGG